MQSRMTSPLPTPQPRGRHRSRALAAALTGCLLVPTLALAEGSVRGDWPQLRGPDRDGVSKEQGLAAKWSDDGPKVLWRRNLGNGFSGIAVADGSLYTLYSEEKGEERHEMAAAFDAETGKTLWSVAVGKEFEDEFGDGPRATPTVDGDTVYCLGSYGRLVALSTKDGSLRWDLELTEAFGAEVPRWGFSTSPLVVGDLLVVEAGGGEGKALVALDKAKGKTAWTRLDGDPGYSSPVLAELAGKEQIIYAHRGEIVALDNKGDTLWRLEWPFGGIAVPIVAPSDRVFMSSAGDSGGILLQVSKGSDGLQAEELWSSRSMKNNFNSSVLYDGHIFGFDNGTLRSVSLETGESTWAKRGLGKGSLIAGGGQLFVLSDRGALVRVEATGEAYQEHGRFQAMEGKSWTAPTLAGGRLFLRNHDEMLSLDLRQQDGEAEAGR